MLKKIICIVLVMFMTIGLASCGENKTDSVEIKKVPDYEKNEFGIMGFWAPYDISEEGLKKYQDAGFNTLLMVNHSLDRTSENQFYLGSERTMTALENCKKLGLKAVLNYNDWIAVSVEDDENYYSETPFSQHDYYGEYKDIITGIHIVDEPKNTHFPIYSDETLINDFKKTYPNADYIVNLIPIHGAEPYGFDSFDAMLDLYDEKFMSHFDTPYISVDLYPFHKKVPEAKSMLVRNHNGIAKKAKETGARTTFILQASTGVEFEDSLTEGDIRYQVHSALSFGADNLQYYCYSVPVGRDYNSCILNADNTPSDIYYYVQKINNEIQSYASVYLAYDWDKAIGVSGSEDSTFYISDIEYDDNLEKAKFENAKHYVDAQGTQDLIISRFTSEKYGEAYMITNFSELRDKVNQTQITFKDCNEVAIYGGADYSGEPKIAELDENGVLKFQFAYGEGVFIVPIQK